MAFFHVGILSLLFCRARLDHGPHEDEASVGNDDQGRRQGVR